jgi:hypothetical protein
VKTRFSVTVVLVTIRITALIPVALVFVPRRPAIPGMENPLHSSRQQMCRLCSEINIEHLSRPKGYEHHKTLKAWMISAAKCRLCSTLLAATLNHVNMAHDDMNVKLKDENFVQSHGIALRFLPIAESHSTNYISIDLTSRFGSTKETGRLSDVFVFTNQDDPAAASGLPWKRELPECTGSEHSYQIADSWLKACLQGHSDDGSVQASSSIAVPSHQAKRLVELSTTSVRVVDGPSVKEPYATLSYRWGPNTMPHWPWGPRQIARSDLVTELDKGLPREDLPKTIREAVGVAERLGFRYVWVDVMCILQNDASDWLDESKNMATIYSQAQLNIAASGSPDKEAGLFNKHSRSQHHLFNGCVQVDSTVRGEPSTLYFWYRALDDQDTGSDAFRDQVDQGHLATRAWVCQERIASPRTLHYGETQLFWQCNHTMATEDNLGTKFPSLEDARPWRSLFLPGDSKQRNNAPYDHDGEDLTIEEFHRLWYSFIIPKHYSRRQLTEQSDKLVAIAGLANRLKSYRKSMRYLAGLWSGLELEGLLWSAQGPGRPFDGKIGYVAPTWSWASRDGGVEYGDFGAAFATFDCRLLACRVETEDQKEFSRAISATLEIEAAFLCGTAIAGETKYGSDKNPTLRLSNDTIAGRALLDDDRRLHNDVHALLLRTDSIFTVFLLVIDHPDRPGKNIRVGIGSVKSFMFPNSFDRLPRSRWVIE